MSKKTENAEFAKEWCIKVESSEKWMDYINRSVSSAVVRKGTLIEEEERMYVKYKVDTEDTVIKITTDKTHRTLIDLVNEGASYSIGVLNFASYYKPGGGFTKGSFAQEESLCAVSGLYQILKRLPVYIQRAKNKCVSSCYNDEIIYNTSVPFTLDMGDNKYPRTIDVVTCAPPNCNRIVMADHDEYETCLKKRIEAIYLLPYLNGVDTLVLGSWGCGVFKNNPKTIAKYFAEVMREYPNIYNRVVFACGSAANQKIFEEVLKIKSE